MPIVKSMTTFSGGEVSPMLDGRTDRPEYGSWCRRLENFIPRPQGGLLKRPGLQQIGHIWRDDEGDDQVQTNFGVLAEFQFTTHSSVMLAIGGGRIRLVDKGRMVKRTVPPLGTPSWSSSSTYSQGSWVQYGGKLWACLRDHASNASRYPGSGAVIAEENGTSIAPLWAHPDYVIRDIPWDDLELRSLRWLQINEVMFLVHPNCPPYQLIRNNHNDWILSEVDFGDTPALLDANIRRGRVVTTDFKVDLDGDEPNWHADRTYKAGRRVSHTGSAIWVCQKTHVSQGPVDDEENYNGPGSPATYTQKDGSVHLLWARVYTDESSEEDQEITLTSNSPIFREGHEGSTWEVAMRRGNNQWEISLEAHAFFDTEDEEENEVVNAYYSDGVLVAQGGWEFTTFGRWRGVFAIEVSNNKGETWKQIRNFRSSKKKPRNASASGDEPRRVLMRLKFRPDDNFDPAAEDGGEDDPPEDRPYARLTATSDRIRGLVKITDFVSAHEVRGECVTPVELGSTSFWAEAAWSKHQGWPRCIALHQNRVLMAGTTRRPHTIWGSAVDDYFNFERGTEADLSYMHTLAIGSRDPILWMHSDRVLVVGNGAGEFTLRGESEDAPVTPEFGTCARQSSYGTHNGGVGCIPADTGALFVQNGGRTIREMGYSFQSDRYESANLNLAAEHLFKAAVQSVAVQRQPWQIIWVVASGRLYSLTHERSQEVFAWASHPVGGEVVSVGTVRRYAEDMLYLLVRRDKRLSIERFVPGRLLEPKDDGSWMDCQRTLVPVDGTYPWSTHPLRHRDGVIGFHMGEMVGPARLNGKFFTGLTGPVTVGLPYTALVQPMTPADLLSNGTSRTRETRIHAIAPNLFLSRGGKAGETPERRLDPLGVGSANNPFSGEIERNFEGRHDTRGDCCLVSDEPYPFTIRSLTLKLNYFGDT